MRPLLETVKPVFLPFAHSWPKQGPKDMIAKERENCVKCQDQLLVRIVSNVLALSYDSYPAVLSYSLSWVASVVSAGHSDDLPTRFFTS